MVVLLKEGIPNEVNVLDVFYPSLTCPCDTDNYISPFFKKKPCREQPDINSLNDYKVTSRNILNMI